MFEGIYNHQLLDHTIDDLSFNQFNSFSGKAPKLEIKEETVRKCIWLASMLAGSPDEAHQKKVQLFSSLLFLQYPTNKQYVQAVYILFSRIGNLTATRFLKTLFMENEKDLADRQFNCSFGEVLNLELALARGTGIITISDQSYLTTKFQKQLWSDLENHKNIAISAPTSSGKSFIIKKFINQQLGKNTEYRVLYIVPSKALINQVSEEIRNDINLSSVDIKTAYLSDVNLLDKEPKSKEILILTPERCLKLLQKSWAERVVVDLVFIDEIQNLEDSQGRGSLFEFVLKELSVLCPEAKLISAGPNIHLPGKLFTSVTGQQGCDNETVLSPVFQMMAVVKPGLENNLVINLVSRTGSEQALHVETDFNLAKEFKGGMGNGLTKLLNLFGEHEQNIIYSPQANLVEGWALNYAKQKAIVPEQLPDRVRDLIEFLKEEIHPRYYLIRCLEAGVAFHHSRLPDIVRKEIEDAFSDGDLKDLYCTSTLMEGVNLPANNLFVISPKKRNTPLTNFEFGNLIGRAGRIKDSLYGTIYCVLKEGENWPDRYLGQDYQKIVVPASDRALQEKNNLLAYLGRPIAEVPLGIHSNTVILLRQKFLRSKTEVVDSLVSKGLDENYTTNIVEQLQASLKDLEIPSEIVRLNPSVDPFLQNELYRKIKADGIAVWCVDNRIKRSFTKEEASETSFGEKNVYWQLSDVMNRMDSMFGIFKESMQKNSIAISINQMCLYALRWMDNKSYGELIENELAYWEKRGQLDREDEGQVNSRISKLIKIYSNVVSFICVKYLKLLVDVMSSLMTEQEKEHYKYALALPTYLELGSSDPIVIQLVTRGVARSVAIKVARIFKKIPYHKNMDIFDWLSSQSSLSIKPIYNRYLRRLWLLGEPLANKQ